jgi:hypothetical protein
LERRLEIHYGVKSGPPCEWHNTLDALHLMYVRVADVKIDAEIERKMLNHARVKMTGLATKDFQLLFEAGTNGLKAATGKVLTERMLIPKNKARR